VFGFHTQTVFRQTTFVTIFFPPVDNASDDFQSVDNYESASVITGSTSSLAALQRRIS
jgi:hypothetical protein